TDMNEDIKTRIANAFGLVYDELNDYEKELIEAAYDKTMSGDTDTDTGINEEFLLYGYDYYEPFTITLTHILNRKAGISFTSYAHTAVPVPVYAKGREARRFNGNYDNTDIARKFADIMKVDLNN
ncbi:MAG: alkaline phosphatase, partial [Thermodesulfobacteriota bacterium]|nr:alkaline phosphatase [Thermodesulfobacteriota bacterium]